MLLLASLVLPLLGSSPNNLSGVLSTIRETGALLDASPTELSILAQIALGYTSLDTQKTKWAGFVLIRYICSQPTLLARHGREMFQACTKAVAHEKNDRIYRAALRSLVSMVLQIKGKPTLTREIVTPNLSGAISSALNRELDFSTVKAMLVFIRSHHTLFRPHAVKYEKLLVDYLRSSEFSALCEDHKQICIELYVILSIVSKTQSLQWSLMINTVFKELKSVLELMFSEVLNCENEPAIHQRLEKLVKEIVISDARFDKTYLEFPILDLDFNDTSNVAKISLRIGLLAMLLRGFITTKLPFKAKLPVGRIILVCELLGKLSPFFLGFQTDLLVGNASLKTALETCCLDAQLEGAKIISAVCQELQQNSVTCFSSFLKILVSIVPVQEIGKGSKIKRILDAERIKASRYLLLELVKSSTSVLSSFKGAVVNDFGWLLQIIDMAMYMLSETQFRLEEAKKKGSKKAVDMSDYVANKSLLLLKLGSVLKSTIFTFFCEVIRSVNKLPLSQYIKIQRFAILEAVSETLKSGMSPQTRDLLKLFVLYPNENSRVNILPIFQSLIEANGGQDELLSLLLRPRFVAVGYEKKETKQEIGEEVIQEIRGGVRRELESEFEERVYEEVMKRKREWESEGEKRRKVVGTGVFHDNLEVSGQKEVPVETSSSMAVADVKVDETLNEEATPGKQEQPQSSLGQEEQKQPQSTIQKQEQPKTSANIPEQESKAEDDDSDFEMPEIAVDSSSDEEEE